MPRPTPPVLYKAAKNSAVIESILCQRISHPETDIPKNPRRALYDQLPARPNPCKSTRSSFLLSITAPAVLKHFFFFLRKKVVVVVFRLSIKLRKIASIHEKKINKLFFLFSCNPFNSFISNNPIESFYRYCFSNYIISSGTVKEIFNSYSIVIWLFHT